MNAVDEVDQKIVDAPEDKDAVIADLKSQLTALQKRADAMLQVIEQQRNEALTRLVTVTAELALLQAENK